MADETRQCTGADDPRERCGRHHPLAILDGRTCCCDSPWLDGRCSTGAAEGDPVSLEAKLEAMLGHTVADTPHDVRSHIEGVMDILKQHTTMPDGYRQRCADAAMTAWGQQATMLCDHSQIIPIGAVVDAVLAVRDDELERLRIRLQPDDPTLASAAEAAAAEVEAALDDGDRAWAEVEKLRALVRDLAYTDPCEHDHHGNCQAHGWLKTDPGCPHARARDALASASGGAAHG